MKRSIAFIILLALTLCLLSCGGIDDTDVLKKTGDNTITGSADTQTSAPEETFVKGTNTGKTYRSTFIGIGITLSDEWTLFGEESLTGLTNSVTIFDMYALTGNGASITVIFEDLRMTGHTDITSIEYAEASAPETVSSLERLGYGISTTGVEETTVGGVVFDCISLSGALSGSDVTLYEKLLCRKCGYYMAVITVGATDEGTVNGIISEFVKV